MLPGMHSFTSRDGITLTYRLEGSGPLLVCHPGGPGFDCSYLGDMAGLGATRTLLLLNPRGTSASDEPEDPRAYQIDDYVADLGDLREHLGLESMALLGHSHGGVVAMAWAAAYPSRVHSLVLMSTLARFKDKQRSAMNEAMLSRQGEPWYADARAAVDVEESGEFDEADLPNLIEAMMPFYVGRLGDTERAYINALQSAPTNANALKLWDTEVQATFDLLPVLDQISAPTLVMTSDLDFITGPVCAREIADAISGAELSIIKGCGHFAIVEDPNSVRNAVEGFLSHTGS
jgi:proline-specific peptidase